MGSGLKHGSLRPLFIVLALAAVYVVVLPGNWPKPEAEVDVPPVATLGEDMEVEVAVRAWHANFRVRQISFSVGTVNSTALVSRKRPFIPVNLLEREKVDQWSVGFAKRGTWPRSRVFRLTVPLKELLYDGLLQEGELQGSINVIVDHTKVTMREGYPPLTGRYTLPYSVALRR